MDVSRASWVPRCGHGSRGHAWEDGDVALLSEGWEACPTGGLTRLTPVHGPVAPLLEPSTSLKGLT